MKYAEVAVDAPVGFNRTLTYAIPSSLRSTCGQMVWAPLGQRVVQGIVFEVTNQPQVEAPRQILSAMEPSPLLSPGGLDLARWISRYYLSSLFEAASLMLPPGFKDRVDPYLEPVDMVSGPGPMTDGDQAVWQYVLSHRQVSEREVRKALGPKGEAAAARLVRRGLLRRGWRLPRPRTAPKYSSFILPYLADGGNRQTLEEVARRSPPQSGLLRTLLKMAPHGMPLTLARKEYGASAVKGLMDRGLLAQEWVRSRGHAEDSTAGEREPAIALTPEQAEAVAQITASLEGDSLDGQKTFLIHGVTGSGKTEVYLRALERCVALGRQGILLVPEISLTPQMMHRLSARFPGRVALMHSGLSLREQFDYWWRIRDGAYDVVVGPRSALFSPLPRLGLIVLDEEHEWTYKERERSPRYHAREVALKLSQLFHVPLVMGSATPDVVTYHRALSGRLRLLELPYRIGPAPLKGSSNDAGLAQVEVQDMRRELREGNRSPFSQALACALTECVDRGEQAILFLNRRGSATLVQCRDCGLVLRCRRCAVALTYHRSSGLLCHHCNRRQRPPSRCPSCRSPRIRYLGLGTQRVVEELQQLLPRAGVLRWDRDSARELGGHQVLMEAFSQGQAQVLVGTQMIAKGLHVPNVSLVGVILADVGLHLPDFRAGEHTFQLLCQVAGRAGRGSVPGRVIIQTYSPESYAIQAAARQDYHGLYKKELEYRREQRNPPFSRLVHMTYLHTSEKACRREAARFAGALRAAAFGQGLADMDLIGPAPAHPQRVRGRFRWHLLLRGRNPHALLETVTMPKQWVVDVDPVTVL